MVVLQALLGSILPVQDVPDAVSRSVGKRHLVGRHLKILRLHSCGSLPTLNASKVSGTILASLLRMILLWISLGSSMPKCGEIVTRTN